MSRCFSVFHFFLAIYSHGMYAIYEIIQIISQDGENIESQTASLRNRAGKDVQLFQSLRKSEYYSAGAQQAYHVAGKRAGCKTI